MVRVKEFLKNNRPIAVLMAIVLVLTAIPVLDIFFVLGNTWQGMPPNFTDETFYYARVQTIVKDHPTGGNPYFLEHADGPPLVIFAGAWINAIPQLAGLPLNASLIVNFILWSMLFALALYYLFRELRVPPWIAVFGTVILYLQSYSHVWRPVNLQTVYPFYFLFYLAFARLIREQNKRNIVFLGLVTGAMFYLFAYMWQASVITLGLLVLYAIFKKNWVLMRATLLASILGGIIGLPVPLYALWLSHSSPYFWESVGRLGLVNTHLPMAEVIYSGGWIGFALVFLVVLLWRTRVLRENKEFVLISLFFAISGLGLWIMQGSNLITGKLLETGEHVRLLIQPWLIFFIVGTGAFLWRQRAHLSRTMYACAVVVLVTLSGMSVCYAYQRSIYFIPTNINHELWQTQQLYVKPFAWLDAQEKNPVVVWSNPRNFLTTNLPVFTRHFTLYVWAGMMELVPEGEIRERYLVSEYFNNPTATDLKSLDNMLLYLGRRDLPHQAKTIERGVKICRILFFWNKNKDCGEIPTPQSLLGDKFFNDLANKFKNDIKPNIKDYLDKYHVTYILKDKVLDSQYHPEALGAVKVYTDDKYEIWHL